ncbi:ejaculatory bulb-specific protein 3-like [Trichogramma pretiosum]|uniref:ejaculatory bulb-specific protein 3-like n=1 Tax=Trichogramma pretiosum TaxID=7493 RepID=UPI0006C9BDA4|nr:ejaculatory bulb-specific protein 3-like [Trichogramma pretiosum]
MAGLRYLVACLAALSTIATTSALDPNAFLRMDAVLADPALFQTYLSCFVDEGECPPDGQMLKKLLPELIATRCNKCTENERRTACNAIMMLEQPQYAREWQKLQQIYDPRGVNYAYLNRFKSACASMDYA